MKKLTQYLKPQLSIAIAGGALLFGSSGAFACGGFFCSTLPIIQAQEQIIFKVDGRDITTMVQIQYAGDAEDFAWVLPVPGIPDISLGNNAIFPALEQATRPRFSLQQVGQPCDADFQRIPFNAFTGASSSASSSADGESGGVEVLSSGEIGPFEQQVVSSDDPSAMAQWLVDNNYLLSERGEELLKPYIDMGMNFLALKLKSDAESGDIQPIILDYQSDKPMVPLQLTAIAAQADMGILVWLLGDERAVPDNYHSVVPNYTKVDWFRGVTNAYRSYQTLITDAMDETGGKGFATDYAGPTINIEGSLSTPEELRQRLTALATENTEDISFLTALAGDFRFPTTELVNAYNKHFPIETPQPFIGPRNEYRNDSTYAAYSAEALSEGRKAIVDEIQSAFIDTLEEGMEVLKGKPYMTRLYTTLSAEDMTSDPTFVFNDQLPEQGLERTAKLNIECPKNELMGTQWQLTLEEGTQREGELVMKGKGLPPTQTLSPAFDQSDIWLSEQQQANGEATPIQQKTFKTLNFVTDSDGTPQLTEEDNVIRIEPDQVDAGSFSYWWGLFGLLLFKPFAYRLTKHRKKAQSC